MKAVLLNDTSARYHHGCSRVSRRIKTLLAERDIEVSASNPAHENWRSNDKFLAALAQCDVIVINGEGTLHSGAKRGAILLEILSARERRGKPVALVNALWQNNPAEWIDLLTECDIVSVRDSHSLKELTDAGVAHARLAPDLSLTGPIQPSDAIRDQRVVGDSVRLECRQVLARAAQFQSANYLPTKYLEAAIWQNKFVSAALWRLYNGVPFGKVPLFRMVYNDEDYLGELQGSMSHVTGRFHGVCLSMLAQTPFMAVASKTTKIQALLEDVGIGGGRTITHQQLEAQLDCPAPPFSDRELAKVRAYISLATAAA